MPKPFRLEDHRWELCKAFLERADKSGELLRALLFAAGSAGVAFALQQIARSRWHFVAAALFAVGVIIVFWSWDLQKRKAKTRFELVRDKGIDAYLKWEKGERIEGVEQQYESNLHYDRTAAIALGAGAVAEAICLLSR